MDNLPFEYPINDDTVCLGKIGTATCICFSFTPKSMAVFLCSSVGSPSLKASLKVCQYAHVEVRKCCLARYILHWDAGIAAMSSTISKLRSRE